MGLITDAQRITIGQNIEKWKNSVISHLNECDRFLQMLVDAKTTLPADDADITTYLDAAKSKLQSIIDKY